MNNSNSDTNKFWSFPWALVAADQNRNLAAAFERKTAARFFPPVSFASLSSTWPLK